MKLPLVSNDEIRKSDSGQVTIAYNEVRSIPQDQINDVLSKEYTRMVQENPEHAFWILFDPTSFGEKVVISWEKIKDVD
jgi:hypothetical protein